MDFPIYKPDIAKTEISMSKARQQSIRVQHSH